MRKVLFHLATIVEETISQEMQIAKHGSIMHDGWSKFGTHYTSLFVQYNRTVIQNTGKLKKAVLVPTSALLAMRPMPGIVEKERKETDEGEDEDNESSEDEEQGNVNVDQDQVIGDATTFTAEVHAEFFRNVMKKYKVRLEEWALCQVELLNLCIIIL